MNLILLSDGDFVAPARVRLGSRRLAHVRDVLRAAPGDRLRVGRLGGQLGEGRVVAVSDREVELEVTLAEEPPPPLPIAVAVALPRPPSLRKVLQGATALGCKRIVLFQSARVERSYWQSRRLAEACVHEDLRLGLEQARDTRLPEVFTHRRFESFLERELAEGGPPAFFAHPDAGSPAPHAHAGPALVVIGPEGGLLDAEIEGLEARGASAITLGPRVLRVEHAVVALLARLSP